MADIKHVVKITAVDRKGNFTLMFTSPAFDKLVDAQKVFIEKCAEYCKTRKLIIMSSIRTALFKDSDNGRDDITFRIYMDTITED